METKEWFKTLAADARIGVRTEGRPIERYAVRLELLRVGGWRTVHLFDNAHDRHDEHRYIGLEKQDATAFFVGDAQHALPEAIRLLDERWERMIEQWSSTSDD